jgi:hypothetical protein
LRVLKRKLESVGAVVEQGTSGESEPGRKMSEVLVAFIEPYLGDAPTRAMKERLVSTAVMAWNASLMPEDERTEFLDEAARAVLAGSGKQAMDEFMSVVRDLIERKQRLFSGDERIVVSYQFRAVRGGTQLAVASARDVSRDTKEPD